MTPRQAIKRCAWSISLPSVAVGAAVEGTAVQGPGLPVSPLGATVFMETAGGLLLIIGLIIGLSWLFKRFGKRPLTGKGGMSVLGGVSLGPRERAVLVQVGVSQPLVGVAPGRVQTLCVLDRPLVPADTRDGFAEQLKAQRGEDK